MYPIACQKPGVSRSSRIPVDHKRIMGVPAYKVPHILIGGSSPRAVHMGIDHQENMPRPRSIIDIFPLLRRTCTVGAQPDNNVFAQ